MEKDVLLELRSNLKEEIKSELRKEMAEGKARKRRAKAIEKQRNESDSPIFETKREPRKAFATFLRNQNKLYVNTVNVIDRKAAIMIRVNSTIISAVVIFYDYIKEIQCGSVIGVSLVTFSFVSLMLAINGSRPNAFSFLKKYLEQIVGKYSNLEERIFTIGFNNSVSLDDYENAYDKTVKSQKLQIGNQVRAMFLFEKHQRKSIILMELSYISFMVGFSISVGIFVYGIVQNGFF